MLLSIIRFRRIVLFKSLVVRYLASTLFIFACGSLWAQERWATATIFGLDATATQGELLLSSWKDLCESPRVTTGSASVGYDLIPAKHAGFQTDKLQFAQRLIDRGPGMGVQVKFVRVWLKGVVQIDVYYGDDSPRWYMETPEGKRFEWLYDGKTWQLPADALSYLQQAFPGQAASHGLDKPEKRPEALAEKITLLGPVTFQDQFKSSEPAFASDMWIMAGMTRPVIKFVDDQPVGFSPGIEWVGKFNRLNRKLGLGIGAEFHRDRDQLRGTVYSTELGPLVFSRLFYQVAASKRFSGDLALGASVWIFHRETDWWNEDPESGWPSPQVKPNFAFVTHYFAPSFPDMRLELGFRQYFYASLGMNLFR